MRELWDFVRNVAMKQVCRVIGHRWLNLPVDPFPPVLWDRVCMRCLARETRTAGDYERGDF